MRIKDIYGKDEHGRIHRRFEKGTVSSAKLKKMIRRHEALVEGDPTHPSPIITRTTGVVKGFSVGYWGTQGRIYPEVMGFVKDLGLPHRVWADPTCGGIAIPYQGMRAGEIETAYLNDISFWTFCNLHLLSRKPFTDREINEALRDIKPVKGWSRQNLEFLHPKVARWADGFCRRHKENLPMLGVLGSVFAKKYSYRSMMFDKNRCREATIPDVKEKFRRIARGHAERMVLKRAGALIVPYNLDCMDFIEIVPETLDLVYMNFAWPWADGKPTKQYQFTMQLTSMLMQETYYNPDLWTGENIVENVLHILRTLKPKTGVLCLNTQSSNYPPGPELEAVLDREFGDDLFEVRSIDMISFSGTRKKKAIRVFRQWFFYIKGEHFRQEKVKRSKRKSRKLI